MDVLDVGCNQGLLTISVAAKFFPRSMKGIDIDEKLIKKARKNLDLYKLEVEQKSRGSFIPATCYTTPPSQIQLSVDVKQPSQVSEPIGEDIENRVLSNISFETCNFVSDTLEEQYDTVMCMSVTKWVQLNWGDEGLKKMFEKIFKMLRPGGKFVLEPQPRDSYKKNKMTELAKYHFGKSKLRPEEFSDYLTGTIGYESVEVFIPDKQKEGFKRPIFVFTKSE